MSKNSVNILTAAIIFHTKLHILLIQEKCVIYEYLENLSILINVYMYKLLRSFWCVSVNR
jgi:hypothetical protein